MKALTMLRSIKSFLFVTLIRLDQMRNWFSSNGYHWQSNPVLTGYPWGLAGWLLNTGWPLAKRDAKKTPFWLNSPRKKDIWTQSANIGSGDKHGKFDLRDYYWFFLGVFALGDRSIQVENNTKKPLGLSQGWPRPLNRGGAQRSKN